MLLFSSTLAFTDSKCVLALCYNETLQMFLPNLRVVAYLGLLIVFVGELPKKCGAARAFRKWFGSLAEARAGACRVFTSFRALSTAQRAITLPESPPESTAHSFLHASCYHLQCPDTGQRVEFPSGPAFFVVAGTRSDEWACTIGQTGALAMQPQEVVTTESVAEAEWLASRGVDKQKLGFGKYNKHFYTSPGGIKLMSFESMEYGYEWAKKAVEALEKGGDASAITSLDDWNYLDEETTKDDFDPSRWMVADLRIPTARLLASVLPELQANNILLDLSVVSFPGCDASSSGDSAAEGSTLEALTACDDIGGFFVPFGNDCEEVILFNPAEVLAPLRVETVTITSGDA